MLRKIIYLSLIVCTLQINVTGQSDSTLTIVKELMTKNDFKGVIATLALQDTLDYEGYKILGDAYNKLYNYPASFRAYIKARELSDYNFDIDYLLGKSALLINDDKKAEFCFNEILAHDSANFLASIELANMFIEQKKYAEAATIFEQLSLSDTTNTFFLNRLAYCEWRMEKYNAAIENYNKVLAINQFEATAALQLGKIYYDSERYNDARAVIEQALTGNVRNLGLNKLIAETFFKLNLYETAVVYYTRSIALGDSSAGIYQKLGFSYYFIATSGNMVTVQVYTLKINESIAALEKSFKLDDQNPLTTLYLGICYKELKDYEKARSYLELTLNIIFPEYMSDIYTHLGAAFEYEGKFSEAISNYLEAYEYEPSKKILLFYLASAMDRFYADRQVPLMYYKKFLKEDKSENGVLIKYAEDRIDKLEEQIHFNGYK